VTVQRAIDIVLAGIALMLLSPLLVPIAIALRFTGEHEIFFVQQRIGRGGKSFGLYKFATMLKDSPNIGTGTVTVKDDPRILPVGRFLRKTKLNELPQLLNILMGDMSIIGPRPQDQRCFDVFPESSKQAILQVRPGLSGIGSIVFRDEESLLHGRVDAASFYDGVIAPYKGALEEWYVVHRGLWTNLMCILLTVWVVLFPRSQAVWKVFPSLPRRPKRLTTGGVVAGDDDHRHGVQLDEVDVGSEGERQRHGREA
jgi:lipopolysaccharide/colanic/teichoic acid biosynthesis glycosyltransferase